MAKSFCYTLNNPTPQDVEQFKALTVKRHRCALEIGDSGTKHLQGTITFTRTYRLSALKKLNPKVHWEVQKCSDAENYCTKGDIIIDVCDSKQGCRTDLEKATSMIKEGQSIEQVAREHPTTYVKYPKGLSALKQALAPYITEFTPTNVYVHYGKGVGTGKTRSAFEADPKLYVVPEPINGLLWFDGYEGEQTILLDDFYGWVKYHTLLNLTDGYPMRLPVKGGFARRNWTNVYITSNQHPSEWYDRKEWKALERRIKLIKNFDKNNKNAESQDSQDE